MMKQNSKCCRGNLGLCTTVLLYFIAVESFQYSTAWGNLLFVELSIIFQTLAGGFRLEQTIIVSGTSSQGTFTTKSLATTVRNVHHSSTQKLQTCFEPRPIASP